MLTKLSFLFFDSVLVVFFSSRLALQGECAKKPNSARSSSILTHTYFLLQYKAPCRFGGLNYCTFPVPALSDYAIFFPKKVIRAHTLTMAIFQLMYVVVPIGGIIYGTPKEKQFRASIHIKESHRRNNGYMCVIRYGRPICVHTNTNKHKLGRTTCKVYRAYYWPVPRASESHPLLTSL